ncbi:GPI mannosyltransferase 1 [Babesia duncani]|uniref:GPI mannosyltransferase I n=1 Tax=Babesia duncani TaxID=323732 RepID=A0AAD9PGH7_9APIC|nr:GPI mannosyltransferase 1 [Babesia duncani]KAK2198465.1 GPI mannosyltransferase 1 [Babesia duncani]
MNPTKFKQLESAIHNESEKRSWRLYMYAAGILARMVLIYQAAAFGDSRKCSVAFTNYLNPVDVKYTDIDYRIYTDGAKLMAKGESIYDVPTYRYTPILALILLPNVYIPFFGKILFSVFDILAACIIEMLLETQSEIKRLTLVSFWLLNPFVICISTRGNADCLICLVVLATVYALKHNHIHIAGLL